MTTTDTHAPVPARGVTGPSFPLVPVAASAIPARTLVLASLPGVVALGLLIVAIAHP